MRGDQMTGRQLQQVPRVLSAAKLSVHYNEEWLKKIDKVFVDGVHLPNCVYYSIDKGEARGLRPDRSWGELKKGRVTVTVKP